MASIKNFTTWGSNVIRWKESVRVATFVKVRNEEDIYIVVMDKRGLDACHEAYEFVIRCQDRGITNG